MLLWPRISSWWEQLVIWQKFRRLGSHVSIITVSSCMLCNLPCLSYYCCAQAWDMGREVNTCVTRGCLRVRPLLDHCHLPGPGTKVGQVAEDAANGQNAGRKEILVSYISPWSQAALCTSIVATVTEPSSSECTWIHGTQTAVIWSKFPMKCTED